ncbi:MAG TPA: hypothetical protein VHS78_08875 [Candidatus Elarobacter sp.]|jgi:hypothetical protein|nr:hypothetical protein [Candidatus Elarobacter sp.]
MTSDRAKWITLLIYLVCLAAVLALLYLKKSSQPSFDLTTNIETTIGLYAVPLSIIVAGVSSRRAPPTDVNGTALMLLFGSTVLWNAVVVGTIGFYDWATMTVVPGHTAPISKEDLAKFFTTVPEKLSFLISGALTYFFVGTIDKQGTVQPPAQPPGAAAAHGALPVPGANPG